MDDFACEIIVTNANPVDGSTETTKGQSSHFHRVSPAPEATDEPTASRDTTPPLETGSDQAGGKPRQGGLRGHFSAFRDKTSIQDRLVEKLLQHVIPDESSEDDEAAENAGLGGAAASASLDADDILASRPGFNLTTMSNNFRRFNARIGVVFRFQVRMIRLFRWRKSSHTLSFLAVYTFVCLDPYLIVLLPLAGLLLGVLIPSFMARHPPLVPQHHHRGGSQTLQVQQQCSAAAAAASMEYSPRGPPLAPAKTVKPVKELSRDFFRNMRDLQNSMEDFSMAHDSVIALLVPMTNFSDEALSSCVFLGLLASFLLLSIAAHLIPWKFAALIGGWAAVLSGHPVAKRMIAAATMSNRKSGRDLPSSSPGKQLGTGAKKVEQAQSALTAWARSDIVLDVAPETREVEIFELQRRVPSAAPVEQSSASPCPSTPETATDEWEPFVFTSSPYDPLSAIRLSGSRPRGTRFFEDVQPPEGWEWSEKKWTLDLWSRDWVEERIITAVEVETEGERWVYDMVSSFDAKGGNGDPVVDYGREREKEKAGEKVASGTSFRSWEEGVSEEGVGRRGGWRRRRWVRLVKRRGFGSNAG